MGLPVRDKFAVILQIAVENKKLLSSNVDNYKAIILRRTDDFKDFVGLDGDGGMGDGGMMVVSEGEDHHGEVDTIAHFRLWDFPRR
jgi:hypothetical protein